MKRRDLLKTTMTAGMLAAPFLHIRPARADKGELVVVSWGGDYDQAIRDLVVPAFQKNTGFSVKMDAPPETAKVKAMVQSGNISWDANGGAFELLSTVEAADLNTSPENIKEQYWQNVEWWSTPGPDGKTPREIQAARFAKWMLNG